MLTGKDIHDAYNAAVGDQALCKDWADVSDAAKERYAIMAIWLNERARELLTMHLDNVIYGQKQELEALQRAEYPWITDTHDQP